MLRGGDVLRRFLPYESKGSVVSLAYSYFDWLPAAGRGEEVLSAVWVELTVRKQSARVFIVSATAT